MPVGALGGQPLPDSFEQGRDATAGDRGNGVEGNVLRLEMRGESSHLGLVVERVDLVRGDDLWLPSQEPRPGVRGAGCLSREARQLVANRGKILDRVATRRGRDVYHMDENTSPFEVAEELMAEPVTNVCPFDETGYIRDHEAAIIAQAHYPEVRGQRRKRIVRNLGVGGGDTRDERGLSDVRKPNQADVGKQLQLQVELPHFTRLSRVNAARRAVCRGRKPLIPSSAPASSGYLHAVIDFGQIRELDEPLRPFWRTRPCR